MPDQRGWLHGGGGPSVPRSACGEGVYSVVYNVADIADTMARIASQGGSLVFEESIPAEAVDERNLASDPTSDRFSIKQALFEDICGMRVCLQEITKE